MVQRGRLRRISVFDIEARATPQLLLELELLLLLLAVALSRRKKELREVAAMAFISPVFWGKGRDAREKGIECKSRVFSVFFLVFAKKKRKKKLLSNFLNHFHQPKPSDQHLPDFPSGLPLPHDREAPLLPFGGGEIDRGQVDYRRTLPAARRHPPSVDDRGALARDPGPAASAASASAAASLVALGSL